MPRESHARGALSTALLLVGGCVGQPGAPASHPSAGTNLEGRPDEAIEVVPTTIPSPYFEKDGNPFCFMGANNYYLTYKPRAAVLDVLDTAVEMQLSVLRIWAFLDRGSLDGSVPNVHERGHKEGVYFQYWDTSTSSPAYNDGESGLERLDFILHEARKRGLSLTLVLTNNWRDFGGMDQYLVWYGLDQHHQFFTDDRVRGAYRAWVRHLIQRTNSIDGVNYAEDPGIFSWELANEPRTINYGDFDAKREEWSTSTIRDWASEMSQYIKSLDTNHLVAVGDEGFMAHGPDHWAYQAPFGVDSEELTSLPHIGYGTYHLYPDHWGTEPRFGHDWIRAHIAASRRLKKPMVLEEYGLHVARRGGTSGPISEGWMRRSIAYQNYNRLILHGGGQASLFWMLAGTVEHETPYPDYDHFAVYRGDPTFELLAGFASEMNTEAATCRLAEKFAPEASREDGFVHVRSPVGAPSAGIGDHGFE